MEYHMCRVKHDPDKGLYGDCLRACIASLLSVDDPFQVPHFYEDDCEPDVGMQRIRDFLETVGLRPFTTAYPGEMNWQTVVDAVGMSNPDVPFLFFHGTVGGGDHVVICKDNEVIHNPAWYRLGIEGPLSSGVYGIMVLAKIS